MSARSIEWIARTEFDCVDASGKSFRAVAQIGKPYRVPKQKGLAAFSRCPVSVEPLATVRMGGGDDHFSALCASIDFIRRVLGTFVAYGGKVYSPGSKRLLDIQSPTFCSMNELADFVRPESSKKKRRT